MSAPVATQHAIDDVWQTLTHACACDEIWWLLEGTHAERTTIVKACNRHLGFFHALRPGMFVAFIVLLSSLFDDRSDCITLKSIPELRADPAFDALWAKGRRLYRFRSKSIAHRDVKNDTIDFAQTTGFTYNEVRGILKEACELYDRFAKSRQLAPVSEHKLASADELLKILRLIAK